MADLKTIKLERELQRKLDPLTKEMQREILAEIKKQQRSLSETEIEYIITSIVGVKFAEKYRNVLLEEYIKSAQFGANRTAYQLKQDGMRVGYTKIDAKTRLLLEQSVFEASKSTMDRLLRDIRQVFLDGYDEGKGNPKIAQDLKDYFSYFSEDGLRRIAMTEVNGAHNKGAYIAKQQAGIQYQIWISSEDERVRHTHQEMHGEICKVGESFSNGLNHPGDKNGQIKEWINCRCIARAFYIPDGFMAPPNKRFFRKKDLIKLK